MSLECLVGPTPNPCLSAIDRAALVEDLAHPDADGDFEREVPNLEQHVAAVERCVGLVKGAHPRSIGELVGSDQFGGGLERASFNRLTGWLMR